MNEFACVTSTLLDLVLSLSFRISLLAARWCALVFFFFKEYV